MPDFILAHRSGQQPEDMLEVGCSVGNIANAFQSFAEISYTGIDIDSTAIRRAQKNMIAFRNFDLFANTFVIFLNQEKGLITLFLPEFATM